MSLDHFDLNARVFSAFYRTLQSEGFNKDEACLLAQRGADLLTASQAPSARDPGKPASASVGGKPADNTFSDRPYSYFFSKLTMTRRLALTVLSVLLALGAFSFFNAVVEWARAPRTERSAGRSSVPRKREFNVVLTLASILLVIYGLMIFTMPGL